VHIRIFTPFFTLGVPIFTDFVFSCGIGTLHVTRNFLLSAALAASVLSFVDPRARPPVRPKRRASIAHEKTRRLDRRA
jgi:hypothetical protein